MEFLNRSLTFNAVCVIQQLLPRDKPTGKTLFTDVIKPAATSAGLEARFFDLSDAMELLPLLNQIAEECERTGLKPVIHFEMHGRPTGLRPSRHAELTWDDLRPRLQRINEATALNLLITTATCYGAFMVGTIDPEEAAPFWGLIGASEQVLEDEIQTGFRAFYSSLTASLDLYKAYQALKENVHHPDFWSIELVEVVLALGFGQYHAAHSGPGQQEAFVKRMIREWHRKHGKHASRPTNLRATIRKRAADHSPQFDKFKRRMLMLDRFPENESRFPLTVNEAIYLYEANRRAAKERADR